MKSVFLTPLALCCLARACWAVPVQVQVLGPDKKPVPNAQVRVFFWSKANADARAEPLQATSDARGTATFDSPEVPAAEAHGPFGWATVWSEGLSIATTWLKPGDNTLTLSSVGTARGLVVDGKGQPVANAVVRLAGIDRADDELRSDTLVVFHSTLDAAISEARTDAMGRWSMARLPLGAQVRVWLAEDKFAPASAMVPVAETGVAFDWAAIEAKARLAVANPGDAPDARVIRSTNEDGVLVARPGGTITARLLDPNGKPVVGARVWASRANLAQSALSDAKGEFRITRLGEGDYSLRPEDASTAKDIEWVAGKSPKVTVGAGASVDAGEVRMIRGATIEVRVVDEETGQGIAGVQVMASRMISNLSGSSAIGGTTDAQGRFTLRSLPGQYSVQAHRAPEGYLSPDTMSRDYMANEPPPIEIVEGATQSMILKLKKAIAGAGRLVDEAGQPIPNVTVGFRPDKKDANPLRNTVRSDSKGNWRSTLFEAGAWKPSAQGSDWKVAGPEVVVFPRAEPLDIVLARIPRVAIHGRAVDAEGVGLANVRLTLRIYTVQGNAGSYTERAATTGPEGIWSVEDVPEIAESIGIVARRPGYAVHRAPKATKNDLAWTTSDAVLKKRDARLAGQILGADGQPAADAQVLVASTRALVKADAQGRWNLSDLPSGEVEIVAVSGAQAGAITTNAPNEAATLKLKAPPTLAARDVDRAQAVVEDAWETSRGSQYSGRDTLPAVLASADPDAALLLAGGAAKKPSAASVLQIVRVLARSGDLDALQSWTQNNLDAINEPNLRQGALLLVAQPLVGHDDEAAKKWLALARAGHAALKEDYQRRLSAQAIAVLAARLKEADADQWFEQALALAKSGGNGPNYFLDLAPAVAPVSEAWAVKVIEAAIADAANTFSYGPEFTIGNAISGMARANLPGARRLLAKYGEVKGKNGNDGGWTMASARAQVLGQRAKAGEDVDTLLKEAGQEQSATRAIALVADEGPPARRVELLKRALELAQKQDHFNINETFQVLRRLAPLDRETTRAALDRARQVLEAPRDENDDYNRLRAADVASWAWLYRAFDPGAARLMIEREWALGVSLSPSDHDEWRRWPGMAELVAAMMPLDIERAQQLAERLPISGYNSPAFSAQRAIARWMVASAEERASKPFTFWSADRDDDGRYSNDW